VKAKVRRDPKVAELTDLYGDDKLLGGSLDRAANVAVPDLRYRASFVAHGKNSIG
jgi:hypothetical protein